MDNGVSSYRRFLAGDETGLTEIVRNYKDGLIFYLYGFVGNISLAEELTEETFVKLIIKKPHFSEKSSFKTWLYSIAGNTAKDFLRKQAKHESVCTEDCAGIAEAEQLETAYLQEEGKIILHRAMNTLKSEYRQALWLYYFEELSCSEIAKIMKKSTNNINILLHRARQALKTALAKEGFTHENL